MTMQTPDRIIINGVSYYTHTCPLDSLADKKPIDYLSMTSNYRGYLASWRIENDKLFLVSLRLACGDRVVTDYFPLATNLPVIADFYSGIIKFWKDNTTPFFMGVEIFKGIVIPPNRGREMMPKPITEKEKAEYNAEMEQERLMQTIAPSMFGYRR